MSWEASHTVFCRAIFSPISSSLSPLLSLIPPKYSSLQLKDHNVSNTQDWFVLLDTISSLPNPHSVLDV